MPASQTWPTSCRSTGRATATSTTARFPTINGACWPIRSTRWLSRCPGSRRWWWSDMDPALTGRLSRRRLLGGVAGLGLINAAGVELAGCASSAATAENQVVAFHGAHQAGITTDIQDRLAFAAFDVTTTRREDLQRLLKTWTAAAAAMSVGAMVPGDSHADEMPPADTGEAVGLPPTHLTVTLGFGPSLFDGRFGLAPRRPAALADLPALPREMLDPARSGGDIGIQACANAPQVAFHAVRNLARLGRGTVVTR